MFKRQTRLFLAFLLPFCAPKLGFGNFGDAADSVSRFVNVSNVDKSGNPELACSRPSNLSVPVATIFPTQANLQWLHPTPSSVDFYEIEIRPGGATALLGTPTHTALSSPFTVTSLESGRTYTFKVRAVCVGGEVSGWSNFSSTFRTAFSNPSRCNASYSILDTVCPAPASQIFPIFIQNQGNSLGNDYRLRAVRLIVQHNWRSDLTINLTSPDGTTVKLIEGLNSDTSLGNPNLPCPAFLELTNDPGSLPLGVIYQVQNPTGRFQPRNPITVFNNGQNPNGKWLLDLCDQRVGGTGTFRWVELVFEDLNCPAPTGLAVSSVDLNSADVSWTNSACDSLVLEYGFRGFLPGDAANQGNDQGIEIMACPAANNLTINNLQPFQFYEIYVRRKCQGGVWSANSQPVHFFTDCQPTLFENFENQTPCDKTLGSACQISGLWQNSNSPADSLDWKVWQGIAPSTPQTGSHTDADRNPTGKYLYFETTPAMPGGSLTTDSTAILHSRCVLVNAQPGSDCHFAFDFYGWNLSSNPSKYGKLAFEISTDGGQNWQNLLLISGVQPKGWQHFRVDLSNFDGQVAEFRFVATGVRHEYADILLDNLKFYGSVEAVPANAFYRDADGDGFGNLAQPLSACAPNVPPGFVSNANDCDDANENVFPGATEVICNGIDEGCNGLAGDTQIPPPAGKDTSVCHGQVIDLQALGTPLGNFYWFENPTGGMPTQAGSQFQISNFQFSKTYWLADSITANGFGCISARTPVVATANPVPRLSLDATPAICSGQVFDLGSLPIFDSTGTVGQFSYFSTLPPDPVNRLSGPFVNPSLSDDYFIFKTTPEGCRDFVKVDLTVRPSPSAIIAQGDSTAVCKNGLKKLSAIAFGGTPPYKFSWSNGLFFQTIDVTGLDFPANSTQHFSVVVQDSFSCTGADLIKLHVRNSVTQTQITDVQDVTQCNGTDGSIKLTPLNGQAPYSFFWPGGSIQGANGMATLPNLKQGNYRITVSDASGSGPNDGCRMVMPLIVINAPGLQVGQPALHPPPCAESNSGAIMLEVQGTNPEFHWSNGQTGQHLLNVGQGEFSVTITDGACQQVLKDLELDAPDTLKILENNIEPVKCFGGTNGSVDIAIFGGTSPYEISWSNSSDAEDIENLESGFFTVSVTDAKGCEKGAIFNVPQPPKLSLSIDNQQDVRCNGVPQGTISLQTSGGTGTGTYQFEWAHGTNTPFVSNLAAGNYSATVTDQNGCRDSIFTEIEEPPLFNFDSISIKNPTCLGASDGRILTFPTGGTGGYNFSWNDFSNSQNLENLPIGTFSVTATDANGCSISQQNLTLAAPQLLGITLDSLIPVRCFGEENGKIFLSLSGGQLPVSVSWNQFQTDQLSIENLFPGNFTAEIEDARGCAISQTFEIVQPAQPLGFSVIAQNPPNCFGEFSGEVEISTVGGWPPYFFNWNNGQTTENASELPAGNFDLTITDSRGCRNTTPTFNLSQPAQIQPFVSVFNIPCNGNFGNILLDSCFGGDGNFNFLWNRGDTTANVFDLSAGFYILSVTDGHGCLAETDSLEIVDTKTNFKIADFGQSDVSCFGKMDGEIHVELSGGIAPFAFSWSHLQNVKTKPEGRDTVKNLSPGTYSVVAIDKDGCFVESQEFLISENPHLLFQNADIQDVRCKGDSSGQIETNVSGGLPPYAFQWNNGSNLQNPTNLTAGNYHATVTDGAGCTVVSDDLILEEPAVGIEIALDNLYHDNCGPCKGAIDIHTVNGIPPFHYLWSEDSQTQDVESLCPGEYFVTVTDSDTCSQVAHYQILSEPSPLDLSSAISDVFCHGDSTGSAIVTPSGGSPDYSIFWSTGVQGNSATGLWAADHSVSVTDEAGCTKVFGITISEPDALGANVNLDSLPGGWSMVWDVFGGVAPLSAFLTDAGGIPISPAGLISGFYFLNISDNNGCSQVLPVKVGTVASPELPIFEKIGLAPNPVSEAMSLTVNLLQPESLRVEIFSSTGELLFREVFSERRLDWFLGFDWAGRPSGAYFLKVSVGGKTWVLRFLKM